jgi:[NiFe] hydrogenase diaphorase moiety large subunit
MSEKLADSIGALVEAAGGDRTRLMDVVRGVQAAHGHISDTAMEMIAERLGTTRVAVQGVVSFYHYLSDRPAGQVSIHLSDCVSCRMAGAHEVAEALEQALGIAMGECTPCGSVSLGWTSCIGLCDHGPAALIDDVPVIGLTPDRARELGTALLAGTTIHELVTQVPVGASLKDGIVALVPSNVRAAGPVVLGERQAGEGLKNAVALEPLELIERVKNASLCGRGGAGFPTGLKWLFCRQSPGEQKVIICNADEGEPGTFKDRAILVERPGDVIEGMAIAAWAVGAQLGIIYLRCEYSWLQPIVQAEIDARREAGLLGQSVAGKAGFDFDVRIQMGAGAYVCGEESALIESCEGERGCPRHRPPFPVQRGYLGLPTVVNNVETFCVATDLMAKGFASVARLGTGQSRGTKLFSVSGDCAQPGVWELPFGLTVHEFLKVVGGEGAIAVQIGGPSGRLVPPADYGKKISFEELSTGGSMIVFGPGRDLLQVTAWHMAFFVEESCGWCVPCRTGNKLLLDRLERILAGKGLAEDPAYLRELSETVKATSRCGLGQSSPNPVLSLLDGFGAAIEARLPAGLDRGRIPAFDLEAALGEAVRVQGRQPVFHHEEA